MHNAARYTESGGSIRLVAETEGEHVLIRVKDNGIGIARENLQRVFDMFTQVGRSIEQSRGGLGVGLSLSQWLVRLHGGTMRAESAGIGSGSEFIVRMPAASAPAPDLVPADAPQSQTRAATRRRVLVVDDNRDFADSLAAVLRLAGHDVKVSYDGLDAVDAAAVERPDVVLLDIGMPLLNGYDTARRIRATLAEKNPTIVAITGWGQEEDRRRSRAAGFDLHLVKPIDPAALTAFLARDPAAGEPAVGPCCTPTAASTRLSAALEAQPDTDLDGTPAVQRL